MSTSEHFTRDLARLVWLLVYRPSKVDDQKRALRELVTASQNAGHRVDHAEISALVSHGVNKKPLPEDLPWLSELGTRMSGHSVRGLEIAAGVRAAELLGLARALSRQGSRDDQGEAFDREVTVLAPASITVQLGRDGFVRTPTPPNGVRAFGSRPAQTPTPAQPNDSTQNPALSTADLRLADKRMMQDGVMPPELANDLSIKLRGDLSPETAQAVLHEVTRFMEDAARREMWRELLDVAGVVLQREAAATDPEVKRAFAIHFKQFAKPGVIRGVAKVLPVHRDLREGAHALLVRMGDPAADALIELMVAAESASERRAYRDAVAQCPGAVEPLTQLLKDDRWFVVRNAAELLGELNATDADQELINTLKHSDPRVRNAATLALIKLGTPRATHTIIRALTDGDASVRHRAALGLGRVSGPRALAALLEGIDQETDERVQHAMLASLGRHPVPEAIARLVEESRPGPILRRRPIPRRLAAIQGLGEARTAEALVALRTLTNDRESSIRDLAARMLQERQPSESAKVATA